MTIRPMTPADISTLVAQTRAIDGGDARDAVWWTAREALVLVDGETVVGHTAWTRLDGFVLWDQTYVAPAYRGQGWGRRLMAARAAETPGRVFGACREDNAPMVHLLTELGFTVCDVVQDGYSTGDALVWRN